MEWRILQSLLDADALYSQDRPKNIFAWRVGSAWAFSHLSFVPHLAGGLKPIRVFSGNNQDLNQEICGEYGHAAKILNAYQKLGGIFPEGGLGSANTDGCKAGKAIKRMMTEQIELSMRPPQPESVCWNRSPTCPGSRLEATPDESGSD